VGVATVQILAQTNDPRAVQPHLRKLFEAIDHLTFVELEADPGAYIAKDAPVELAITAINSTEGECIPLDSPMLPSVSVEEWLAEVSPSQ
jgi:dynein heavy chain